MEYTEEGSQFIAFIQVLRERCGFTVRQLCEGICSSGTVDSLEKGRWSPNQLLEDYILDRLGVGAEDYEYYMDCEEYGHWRARQSILHCITFEETEQAWKLLEEYRKTYDMGNRLERQFYLAMKAQIRRCQKASGRELAALFGEALRLTVPGLEQKPLGCLALSVKELNLILETEQYRGEGERLERYQEVLAYIEQRDTDRISRAKIHPKAVYFLCRCALKDGGGDRGQLLRCCGQTIEILRKNSRMYYLWELLGIVGQLADPNMQREEALGEVCREWAEWRQVLERTYAEYGVPIETFEFCYLYVKREVYCINDIIRIRREMLGMTRKELCEGICSERTLKRLEQRQTKPVRGIVRELLARLGLPGDFTRTDLMTSSPEARELMAQMRKAANAGHWKEVDRLRERISGLVPMGELYNCQTMTTMEILSSWKTGQISDKEYLARVQETLEMTLPYKAFLKEGEKYLTNQEQTCIQNMMQAMDKESGEYLTCMRRFGEMYQPYIENGLQEAVHNMYEFAMGNVSSEWGNRGEYDISDQFEEIILRGCLRFRRLSNIHDSLYGLWWNYDMRKNNGIPCDKALDAEEELKRCILLSRIAKEEWEEQFYQHKLEMIKKRRS